MRLMRADLESLTFYTPPDQTGQPIELSYAWGGALDPGALYRRTLNRSRAPGDPRRFRYERIRPEEAERIPEDWHPVNYPPPVRKGAWRDVRVT